MVSKEQKKIYNQRHREKKQKEKLEMEKQEQLQRNSIIEEESEKIIVEKKYLSEKEPEKQPEPEPEQQPEPEDDTVTLDKEAYNFLLEHYRKTKEEPKEEPAPEAPKTEIPKQDNKDSFFFQVINQSKVLLATAVPLIGLKLIVSGAQSFIMPQITNTLNTQQTPSQPHGKALPHTSINLEC